MEAAVTRSSQAALAVRYFVTGDIRALRLPLPSGTSRADELWRHTCFEIFLRAAEKDAYCEFNFAPSLQWAAYRFDGYRQEMGPLDLSPPRIEIRQDARCLELQATLNLGGPLDLDETAEWRLGLSTVIEETSGNISYWALAHPAGKPDFHHATSFVLSLPAELCS
jgi:hypothetical protein